MTEGGNSVSRRKECMSELIRVRREAARRAHQDNSQTRREISRWLNTLERKTVWEEAQHRVTEYSVILCQEGIEKVRVHTRETHSGVLEALREPQGC
jgi:hypothetical protein